MKDVAFGFVVHPLSTLQRRLLAVRTFTPQLFVNPDCPNYRPQRISTLKTTTFDNIAVTGHLVSIAADQHRLLSDQAAGVEQVVEAVDTCARAGAAVVGLGAVAGLIGGQGKAVAKRCECAVTTGHTATAWAAAETAELVLSKSPRELILSLVGAPGSVANGILTLLAARGHRIKVYNPHPPGPLLKKLATLGALEHCSLECVTTMEEVAGPGFLTLAASSTGGKLRLSELPTGSLIIDVAAPQDVSMDCPPRSDVLILDGEYVRPPTGLRGFWQFIYGQVTQQQRHIFACFAEPMILSLAGAPHLAHVGRTANLEHLTAVGHLALGHGFIVDRLYGGGRPLSERRWNAHWCSA